MYKILNIVLLLIMVSGCSIFSVPRLPDNIIPPITQSEKIKDSIKEDIKEKQKEVKDDIAKNSDDAKKQLQNLKEQLQAAQLVVADTKQKITLKTKELNDLRNEEIASYIRWGFIASLILSLLSIAGGLFLWIRLLSPTGRTIAICGGFGVAASLCGMYFATYWVTISWLIGIVLAVATVIEVIVHLEGHRIHVVDKAKKEAADIISKADTEITPAIEDVKKVVNSSEIKTEIIKDI